MARSDGRELPLLSATLCLVLAGCSDARAPSETNFRKVLEPVVRDAFCEPLNVDQLVPQGGSDAAAFPIVVAAKRSPWIAERQKDMLDVLDEGARKGLLDRTQAETMARRRSSTDAPVRQEILSYTPTARGSKWFRGVERGTGGSGTAAFASICGATGEVVHVVRWTEPADFFGRKMSSVTYTLHGIDPIPLASAADRSKVAEPVERTVPMVLTSDGWRLESR